MFNESHITSMVHFCAMLGYVSMAMWCTLTHCNFRTICFNTTKACKLFNLCRSEQWKPDGDRANIARATEQESPLLGGQVSLRYVYMARKLFLATWLSLHLVLRLQIHCYAFLPLCMLLCCSYNLTTRPSVVGVYEQLLKCTKKVVKACQCVCSGNTGHKDHQLTWQ